MIKPLTFVVSSATRTAADFEVLAARAARLESRGRVEVMIASLAERTVSDIPLGGSPWHDYTSMIPALEKLFPHPDLVPFVDAEHVRKNQRLLREKLPILRKYKLAAAAQFHMPWMLPEGFFAKYPHLRGPRIDHPRRSRRDAFAICVDAEAGRAFYADMFAQLAREVPELSAVQISTNDAGGGLCWADWLYIGPNGPAHCKGRGMGARARGFVDALRAAAGPGREIDVDLRGNFSAAELREMAHYHDEHFVARPQHGATPRQVRVGSRIDNPVLGVFDPVGILEALARVADPQVNRVVVGFSSNYGRGHELGDVQDKVIDLLETYFAEPALGLMNRMTFLRAQCARWVGEEQADALLEALHDMHDAFAYRAAAVPLFTSNYAGVSMRHVNRPLVAVPENLTAEEEAYWLPHVFNPSVTEARLDYIDFHGGRMFAAETLEGTVGVGPVVTYGARMNGVADRLASLGGPGADVFRRMGTSLRIHASILRSSANFYGVQRIRDRNPERFREPRVPQKVGDWHGDHDLQQLNEFLRDELDNTSELIRILESGGMSQVLTAQDPAEEDTFLLGPDLVGQLKKKTEIMRRHWLDAEQYLSTPHK